MVPPIVIAIPILMYYAILIPYTTEALLGVRLSLFDTYIGLGLLYVATALPFVIWMMLNFIDEIPTRLSMPLACWGLDASIPCGVSYCRWWRRGWW
jgi:ABC-type glycerol-3-phosphate transport system permease component